MASGIPIHGHPWTRAPLVPESEGWTASPPRSVEPIERVIAALDEVAGAPSILDGIRASASVRRAVAVGRSSPSTVRDLTTILAPAVHDRVDGVVAIAATQALATLPGVGAADVLVDLLATPGDPLAAHAAWALAGVPPAPAHIGSLLGLVVAGGLPGVHAQSTLERWAHRAPAAIVAAIDRASRESATDAGRSRLTETLGLVPGEPARARLMATAGDDDAGDGARSAAVAALGDRWTEPLPSIVATLARGEDPLADVARLAALDHEAGGRHAVVGRPVRRPAPTADGLHIAQVHLGGAMDPELSRSGAGDTGGIATLLVTLGEALLGTVPVGRVTTIGRGSAADALALAAGPDGLHRFLPVPLRPGEGSALTSAWPARIAARRGIRRAYLTQGRPDLVHLRMADAGTLAAAEVAAGLGIPTVFTLAPDPHARIAALEATGVLGRGSFLVDDAAQHLWYRVALVDRLVRAADEVVLFPREDLADRLRSLVGFDVERESHRSTVVPEGIDVGRAIAADEAGRAGGPVPDGSAVADLLRRIERLPVARHGLPIVVSAGRVQELKGMARLVAAFAGDPALRARATLVIAGGDLADPSPEERAELDRIDAALARHPAAADAVILLGHRPNGEVAALLAAARHGVGDRIAPDGAYACASHKEEFGLAIVEALAAGLPVVAPIEGGPRTYVEDGRTGVLVDTSDPSALASGVQRALDLSPDSARAEHVTATIRGRYDVTAMAEALAAVYRRAATPQAERLAS